MPADQTLYAIKNNPDPAIDYELHRVTVDMFPAICRQVVETLQPLADSMNGAFFCAPNHFAPQVALTSIDVLMKGIGQ